MLPSASSSWQPGWGRGKPNPGPGLTSRGLIGSRSFRPQFCSATRVQRSHGNWRSPSVEGRHQRVDVKQLQVRGNQFDQGPTPWHSFRPGVSQSVPAFGCAVKAPLMAYVVRFSGPAQSVVADMATSGLVLGADISVSERPLPLQKNWSSVTARWRHSNPAQGRPSRRPGAISRPAFQPVVLESPANSVKIPARPPAHRSGRRRRLRLFRATARSALVHGGEPEPDG